MAKVKTSKRKAIAAEKRRDAWELRLKGRSFQQIADELGFSRSMAHKIISTEINTINETCRESAAEMRRMMSEQLDRLASKLSDKVEEGSPRAIAEFRAIMERKSKLWALDVTSADAAAIAEAMTWEKAGQLVRDVLGEEEAAKLAAAIEKDEASRQS